LKSAHQIRVGPAGWSYKDWEGIVYPKHGSKFDQLAYLASFFDTIEINSPFYRIPPPTHPKSWIRRVENNPDFKFTTKIYRGFTHESAKSAPDDVKNFRKYLDPLMEAKRLGAVLLQYPWSFKNTAESVEKLEKVFADFHGYPLALEVRHASSHSRSPAHASERRALRHNVHVMRKPFVAFVVSGVQNTARLR